MNILTFLCLSIGSILGLLISINYYLLAAVIFILLLLIILKKFLPLVFLCGLILFSFSISFLQKNSFDKEHKIFCLQEGVFEAAVSNVSKQKDGSKKLLIKNIAKLYKVDKPPYFYKYSAHVLLKKGAAVLDIKSGNKIRFFAKAKCYKRKLMPYSFNGYMYALANKKHGTFTVDKIKNFEISNIPAKKNIISHVREDIEDRFSAILGPIAAEKLLAIIVGSTEKLSDDDFNSFKDIGLLHLLAVSGLQITLIAFIFLFLIKAALFLWPFVLTENQKSLIAYCFVLIFIWSFTALVSFDSSAFRACLMITIGFCSKLLDKNSSLKQILVSTLSIMLIIDPHFIIDLGFLLSAAAVYGLILSNEIKIPKISILIDVAIKNFLLCLMAFFATLPILSIFFGEVSFFSVIANFFILPVASISQTAAIFFAFIGYFLGFTLLIKISFYLCQPIYLMAYALKNLSFGSYFLPISLAINPFNLLKENKLTIDCIPVGQGDATLVTFPSGQNMLIDAGGSMDKNFDPGEKIISKFLRHKKIITIDTLIISHPDPDHINGAFYLLDHFPIKNIWLSSFDNNHVLARKLLSKAKEKDVFVKMGYEILGRHFFGDVSIDVLFPSMQDYKSIKKQSTNNASLVIKITYKKNSILLPGDIEKETEHYLLASKKDLRATILKSPHHGSKTSSSKEFIDAVNPQIVWFSVGQNNLFNFPHSQVVKRYEEKGVKIFDTSKDGLITMQMDGKNISIFSFVKDEVINIFD